MATQGFTPAELKVAAERAFAPSNAAGYVAPSSTSSGGSSANIVNSSTGQKGYQVPNAPIPVGWTAITPSDLTPTTTPNLNISNPHDNVNYSPLINTNNTALGLNADGTPKTTNTGSTEMDAIFSKYFPQEPSNNLDNRKQLETDLGIQQKQQKVDDITSQISAITAKANADILSVTGQGRGIPEAIIGGQQAQISKEAAIRVLPLQAELSSAQGNLQRAENTLNDYFKIMTDDINKKYDYKIKLFSVVYDFANTQQKAKLDALTKQESINTNLSSARISDIRSASTVASANRQPELATQFALLAQNPLDPNFNLKFAELQGQIKPKATTNTSTGTVGFIDLMQKAIDSGATPAEAARAVALVAENSGIQVNLETLNAWAEQAKKLSKTIVEEKTNITSKIEEEISNLKNYYSNIPNLPKGVNVNEEIKNQLKKKGYSFDEISKSTVGNIVDSTISNVNSFFSNLFGG